MAQMMKKTVLNMKAILRPSTDINRAVPMIHAGTCEGVCDQWWGGCEGEWDVPGGGGVSRHLVGGGLCDGGYEGGGGA